jgi:hypothetical protein
VRGGRIRFNDGTGMEIGAGVGTGAGAETGAVEAAIEAGANCPERS